MDAAIIKRFEVNSLSIKCAVFSWNLKLSSPSSKSSLQWTYALELQENYTRTYSGMIFWMDNMLNFVLDWCEYWAVQENLSNCKARLRFLRLCENLISLSPTHCAVFPMLVLHCSRFSFPFYTELKTLPLLTYGKKCLLFDLSGLLKMYSRLRKAFQMGI